MNISRISNFVSLASKQKKPSVTKKYKRFNLWFLGAVAVPTLSVGIFNFVIDPYDIFPSPDIAINQAKPLKDNNDRLFKAIDVINLKPKTVFIGSSRTKQGLDPSHPALDSLQPAYNLGLNGPNFYEQLRYLEHAIANQEDIQQVVVGVDFFAFNSSLGNQPTFSEQRLEKQRMILQDFLNSTLSTSALTASQETISDNLNQPKQEGDYGKNGFMPNRFLAKKDEVEWRFEQGIKLYFSLHSDYQLSAEYFAAFEKLVALTKENNIDLQVFISPSHATQWEAIRATGRWQAFEDWKRDLAKVTPVWDFSGYNSITTEPLSSEIQNYADNSHYTKPIGDLILNRIFAYQENQVPDDFGVLITPENIETHLAKIRSDRQVWSEENPEEVKLVQSIYDAQKSQKSSKVEE